MAFSMRLKSAAVVQATPRRACIRVVCAAKKGFGDTSKKPIDTRTTYIKKEVSQRLAKELGMQVVSEESTLASQAVDAEENGWRNFGKVDDLFAGGKQIKAVELGPRAFAVYRVKGRIFVSDALSTAYQYPLIDGKILEGDKGQPIIEVPLDGTQYELETGKVVVWCPRNGPLRTVLGAMKKDALPQDLRVYPIEIVKGAVFVNVRGK